MNSLSTYDQASNAEGTSLPNSPSATVDPLLNLPTSLKIYWCLESPSARDLWQSRCEEVESEWEIELVLPESVEELRGREHNGAAVVLVAGLDSQPSPSLKWLQAVSANLADAIPFLHGGNREATENILVAGKMPRFLGEESDLEEILARIQRYWLLEYWTSHPRMRELMSRMKKLPALPHLFNEVTRELNSPQGSMSGVAEIIAQDPGMAAQLLKQVNSAFFGLSQTVSDLQEAVMFLGGERIKSMILLSSMLGKIDQTQCRSFRVEPFWRHCLATAVAARKLVGERHEKPSVAEQAYTAGLLHDIGKLLLAANLPQRFSRAMVRMQQENFSFREVELEVFGVSHGILGGCLLADWGLPMEIVRAVAWHHAPSCAQDSQFSPLTAVHAANAIFHRLHPPNSDSNPDATFDTNYLNELHLNQEIRDWHVWCQEAMDPDRSNQ